MLSCIDCHLTDKYGTILNPLCSEAITYIIESHSVSQYLSLQIRGYLTIFENHRPISPPISFSISRNLILFMKENASVNFTTTGFRYEVTPIFFGEKQVLEKVQIYIEINSLAVVIGDALFKLSTSSSIPLLVRAEKVYSAVGFASDTIVFYNRLQRAEVSHYVALSDGKKSRYTNRDALSEYNSTDIISPSETSYFRLFVNGMPQPKSNYTVLEGSLLFHTTDLPPENVFLVICFTTIRSELGSLFPATTEYYVARAEAGKRTFTNKDALSVYSDGGIPKPDKVSFFNLYVNGILQPKTNYVINEGLLHLTSADLPPESAFLVLESILLKTLDLQLLPAESEQYNALSTESHAYTNEDELKLYSRLGIPAPETTSYQSLFVNSVLQPPINYSVEKGKLSLKTENVPPQNAILTLQSVAFLSPPSYTNEKA